MPPLLPPPLQFEDKPSFDTVPDAVLQAAADLLKSPAIKGDIAYGGFSPAAGFILHLEDGRKVFAKGSHPGDISHGAQTLRQEAQVYEKVAFISKVAPRFLGTISDGDEDDWHLGFWDFHDPAKTPDIPAIAKLLASMHTADVDKGIVKDCTKTPFISGFFTIEKKWRRAKTSPDIFNDMAGLFDNDTDTFQNMLPVLCSLQDKAPLLAQGQKSFIHGDLRLDNTLTDVTGRVFFIDWPNACNGPAVFDLILLAASTEALGLMKIEDFIALYRAADGVAVAPEDMYVMAASQSGYFADQARRPVPEKLPRLRWMQKTMLFALLRYLARQGVIDSFPVTKTR
ncbi:MAG: aminoglycoside phosphotransferase family protein [Alphaproteobacteria bacterium]|nr:aminoglycoside phosphotransferase family protein [Alphaproteobacteria bacterium]